MFRLKSLKWADMETHGAEAPTIHLFTSMKQAFQGSLPYLWSEIVVMSIYNAGWSGMGLREPAV